MGVTMEDDKGMWPFWICTVELSGDGRTFQKFLVQNEWAEAKVLAKLRAAKCSMYWREWDDQPCPKMSVFYEQASGVVN
jgi:hypothetical protein